MLPSIEQAPYLPFIEQPDMLAMGLSRLNPRLWIEPDIEARRYYNNKLQQRDLNGSGAYQALPESVAAQREFHDMLLAYLLREHGDAYCMRGNQLVMPETGLHWTMGDDELLWRASLWVQDDFCLLQPSPSGYRLTAASLCAASFWRLEDKLGLPLVGIHTPVPGFKTHLADRVERVFEHIKADSPLWRANWSVVSSNALNQRKPARSPGAADALFLRVERQSLLRLPQSGAVVFSIRVYLHPLQQVRDNTLAWPAFCAALRQLSPEQRSYKSVDLLMPALASMGLSLGSG